MEDRGSITGRGREVIFLSSLPHPDRPWSPSYG